MNPFPTSTLANKGYGASGKPVAFGDNSVRYSPFKMAMKNVSNVLFGQLAIAILFLCSQTGVNLARASAFGYAVPHVRFSVSSEKMIGPNASRSIAFVANFLAVQKWSEVKNIACSVRGETSRPGFSLSDSPVGMAPLPQPASIAFCHESDEPIWKARRATNQCQKFWRDKTWIKSPVNKVLCVHIDKTIA